ncbi:efflux RND transporter periplasmic adaptor subunit [Ectothiorhodospira lacustris]|uniref:efflux RND transporter periplasmic adaptor subunit n=1 Tax=Ectothiorhodospira lacustris TaxID=2899127 RepID=UPI001EE8E42E|nr:HlyD family efflux transporter periplasmic adaptor subunit [Ectothiorhodospira lacustris]MCG5500460.1 HlyD family efflux transporter periplasmic adaptor subunit [Ectothiorhodospira lacustris]
MTLPPRIKRFLPLILLAIGIGGFVLLLITRPTEPPRQVAERVWRVTAEEVTPRSLSPQVDLYGHVGSPRVAGLRAAVEADVAQVSAEEGRRVVAGDTLVILDDRELVLLVQQRQADLDDLRAQLQVLERSHARDREALTRERTLLELAERGVNRAQDLLNRNLGSPATLEEAQRNREQQALAVANRQLALDDYEARREQQRARIRRAEAQLAQAGLDLERGHIRAPFDGRVARVDVAPGDRVRVGDALVTLFDTQALEVRVPIPAAHLPAVRQALEMELPPTAQARVDGLTLALELSRLAGETGAGSAGVEGLFRIISDTRDVPLGRFVSLRLSLPPREQVVALPFEALYGLDRVYRLEDGRMQGLAVRRLGEWVDEDGRERILVSGEALRAGDRIITTRLPNAIDGLRVSAEAD